MSWARRSPDDDAGRTGATAERFARFATVGATAWWLSGRRRRERLGRRAHSLRGQLRGATYHLLGGQTATDVSDDVLTSRVRSLVGRTTTALDRADVHCTVVNHVVVLHGRVEADDGAGRIEKTAGDVEGVEGVLSYLGSGPGPAAPSPALRRLHAAAESCGVPAADTGAGIRAVVAAFVERLPASSRSRFLSSLPDDVQMLATPPRRLGSAERLRRFDDFVELVLVAAQVDACRADDLTTSVLETLRQLLPGDGEWVADALPADLRPLWPMPATT